MKEKKVHKQRRRRVYLEGGSIKERKGELRQSPSEVCAFWPVEAGIPGGLCLSSSTDW